MIFCEYLVDGIAAGYAVVDEDKAVAGGGEFIQTLVLQADVVIVRDGVNADDADVGVICEQTLGKVAADETGNSGDEYRASIEVYVGG